MNEQIYEIAEAQIVTTEFGACRVEKYCDGIYTATIGEYSHAAGTAAAALELIGKTMKTLRQFDYF